MKALPMGHFKKPFHTSSEELTSSWLPWSHPLDSAPLTNAYAPSTRAFICLFLKCNNNGHFSVTQKINNICGLEKFFVIDQ